MTGVQTCALPISERATWIAERGYERLLEYARPGVREFELAAELYCYMKQWAPRIISC